METSIVKIGNSKGLIIPKNLLGSMEEGTRVEIERKEGGLLITPLTENNARVNWEAQFKDAIDKGFVPEGSELSFENDFDKNEWTW